MVSGSGDNLTRNLVRAAMLLLLLNALIWIGLGTVGLVRLIRGDVRDTTTAWIVALLMFANAAVFLVLIWGVSRGRKRYDYLTMVYLGLNILLSVTDEFGLMDAVTLVLNLALFGVMVAVRAKRLASRRL